jgi:hypothetical protein
MLLQGIVKSAKIHSVVVAWAILFLVCASTQAGGIRIGDTPARRIAKGAAIPGKFCEGQCLPFANALHAKLEAAGIRSKILSFQYETLPAVHDVVADQWGFRPIPDRAGMTGAHAVVVYDDQGRTYVMDNQSWQPKWIHDASPTVMATQFAGMNTFVDDACVIDSARRTMPPGPSRESAPPSFRASSQAPHSPVSQLSPRRRH